MRFSFDPAQIQIPLQRALSRLRDVRFVHALWARRADLWSTDAVVQEKVAARLGWLTVVDLMAKELPRLRAAAASVTADRFSDVVLLGMGGSSLAPEVLRAVIGPAPGHPRFRVLDSIDPDAIRDTIRTPATTLFVVASKSGSTIEVATLAAEAQRLVRDAGIAAPGSHFMAVTDPDTVLHKQATAEGFREVFLNPSDIGGRYSALSFFGLVPAALMGIDIGRIVTSAQSMADACRADDPISNPGLYLGAAMAAGAEAGRDKLILRMPASLAPFGLWIEQLVAESTGKHGKGILPVCAYDGGALTGDDRLDLIMDPSPAPSSGDGGDPADLGAAFFQWEVATATAGYLLGINPFDEPNVQQAKDATNALLHVYQTQHQLPIPALHGSPDGARLTLSAAAQARIAGADARDFLTLLERGDYFAVLAYLPSGKPAFAQVLQSFQSAVTAQTGCVATIGYGPRYLHSTGQLHKGGPETGVFVVLTAAPDGDRDVPDRPYSFGVLEMAQALGDFHALDRAGRRAMLIHLPTREPDAISRIFSCFLTG